jgi:hypothetical protein
MKFVFLVFDFSIETRVPQTADLWINQTRQKFVAGHPLRHYSG